MTQDMESRKHMVQVLSVAGGDSGVGPKLPLKLITVSLARKRKSLLFISEPSSTA